MSLITAAAFYEGYLSVREGAQGVSRIVRRAPLSYILLNTKRRASPAETPLSQRPSRTLRFPEPAISPVPYRVFIRGSKEKAPVETGAFLQLMGLEPTPKYMDMNLNHARMPIPPQLLIKERETGIEPATPTLARWCSTAEPLAHAPFGAQGV